VEQVYPATKPAFRATSPAWLVLRAIAELLWIDLLLLRAFTVVYEAVRHFRVRNVQRISAGATEICNAVDFACVFYFKEVRCLQRSAAATRLLRNSGVAAEMVIGIQPCPFRAHAWVEIAGHVVNDKPYVSDMYSVMDRC
jgi:hypothetical protein